MQRWWEGDGHGGAPELESLIHRDRYARLRDMLRARDADGNPKIEIKVIDRLNAPLVHGKAGIITMADGRKTCFMGSVNETREAWQEHYELLWEDESEEGIAWTQEEFDFLWNKALPMPMAVIHEIERCADRIEIRLADCPAWQVGGDTDLPRAALAEAPIVRQGAGLQPWQKGFVSEFMRHRETYGKVRLLLADEVGVGKTLSLAASVLMAALLGDGPALILAPATLCEQWQTELYDKLGIPSARWVSRANKKVWIDHDGHMIRTIRGAEDILACPYRVAIVSTGLLMKKSEEAALLLAKRGRNGEPPYGIVVLDEAHKARGAKASGGDGREPNNLLDFMLRIGPKTRHLLLGTATPIQTDPLDLWDLMEVLGSGADHVLGNAFSPWRNRTEDALALIRGTLRPREEGEAWPWLANPIPPKTERREIFDCIRSDLGIADDCFTVTASYTDLEPEFTRPLLRDNLTTDEGGLAFFQENNPVVRHTVLRRREALERAGLMRPVAVEIHPRVPEADQRTRAFFGGETAKAVFTTHTLKMAFEAAEEYTKALMARNKGAGFMKSLLLQRICSSSVAGLATAEALMRHHGADQSADLKRTADLDQVALLGDEDVEDEFEERVAELGEPSEAEVDAVARLVGLLREISAQSEADGGGDPKFRVLLHFLRERSWLKDHGCIVFSQYYDTARWIAEHLAKERFQNGPIPVALYAGAGKSGVFNGPHFVNTQREAIKAAVGKREIRLLVATDAACEGLNLQVLGTLVNIDLPWNPSSWTC